MFSSGVIMLLIFNAVLPPRCFLSVISNRVLVLTRHCPILFPFCVWMLPCRSISCPETLKSEQNAAVCKWKCATQTLFLSGLVQEEIPHWKENYITVVPENLKGRSFFLVNEHIQMVRIIYRSISLGPSTTAPASCTVCA